MNTISGTAKPLSAGAPRPHQPDDQADDADKQEPEIRDDVMAAVARRNLIVPMREAVCVFGARVGAHYAPCYPALVHLLQ
jgi:hypothetical protein